MYNYPRFFTDEFIEHLAASKKFSGYLDIPFQHISDSVLRMMRRSETSKDIKNLIHQLRTKLPHLFLRTTLMVGFPGETEEDFEALLRFIQETKFDHMGAFTYFREEGTPSFDFSHQLPEAVKEKRYDCLMKEQKKIQKQNLKQMIGTVMDVRLDSASEKSGRGWLYHGRHRGQATEVDGLTYVFSEKWLELGKIVNVRIEKIIGDYDLMGKVT